MIKEKKILMVNESMGTLQSFCLLLSGPVCSSHFLPELIAFCVAYGDIVQGKGKERCLLSSLVDALLVLL